MKALILLATLTLPLTLAAKPRPTLESAVVVSQSIDTYNAGSAYMPLYGGIVGVPITRRTNIVVVETREERMTWSEADKKTLVLGEGSIVEFYRYKNYFVVPDGRHKKYRFSLTHLEARR